ncbi:MAG TPA: NYN domain-containing protein [Pirellulales bacterium]|nr:NYN domain-containing protein [Pirellulales bacterium]
MALIIDGYNLLHATGLGGQGAGPGGLERSRLALLNFLAESIDEEGRSGTTVVFDARQAPVGLPRTLGYRGLTVRFAAGYDSADELIEELIRADTSPRRLTVVSSDHRLHRAARQRRAKAVDSDLWYAEMQKRRVSVAPEEPPAKPAHPVPSELDFWLKLFDDESKMPANEVDDIFPPGYADDLDV